MAKALSPVVVVIPQMTRIQSTSSARHNRNEKYTRFYEMRSPSEHPLLELGWI